jgi:hypothetical protein
MQRYNYTASKYDIVVKLFFSTLMTLILQIYADGENP